MEVKPTCQKVQPSTTWAKPDRGISAATSKEIKDYWDLLIHIGSGKNIAVTLDLSNLPGKPAAPMCFFTDVLILYM